VAAAVGGQSQHETAQGIRQIQRLGAQRDPDFTSCPLLTI
jgi:hypothetical protein